MAEETDNTMPEDEALPDFEPSSFLSALMRGETAVPDTAEGVGVLLANTADFIESRTFARLGNMHTPDGVALPVILSPDGGYRFVQQSEFDAVSDNPRWRRGTANMTSLDSLIAHVNRFGDEDSAVFADDTKSAPKLTAVLDYHRQDTLQGEGDEDGTRVHGEYRHGKHRTAFAFPLSDEWQAWYGRNGQKMGMADFAAFLEDNVLDVADVTQPPESAARFVEMNGGKGKIADWSALNALAKSLTIYENAVVTEAVNLSSGEGVLTLKAGHETEVAGVKTTVPTMFFIAIPLFREGVVYRLPVRLRYRKDRGGVIFWYELWRADRAFQDAFHDAVNQVAEQTEATIFYGSPEA